MDIKIEKIISYLFLIVILVYFAQGFFYQSGSLLSRTVLLIWLIIGLGYMIVYLLSRYRNRIGNIIFIFWMMNTIYWILSPHTVSFSGFYSISTMEQYKNVTTVFLSYFPIYIWSRKGIINERYFYWLSSILFIIYIGNFIYGANVLKLETGREVSTNNIAYRFVVLLPLLGLFSNKKIFYLFFFVSLYFVLIGAKRGAIVCMAIESLIFIYYKYKSTPKNNRFFVFLSIILLIGIISIIAVKVFESSEFLQLRLERTLEGDSSGRDKLYKIAFNAWKNGTIIQLLFGNGFAQSVNIIGNYAHNDWLELLVCHGLFGAFLYFLLITSIIVFYIKNKHLLSSKYKMIVMMFVCVWIVRTIVSMGYTDQSTFIYLILIALLQCKINKAL